MIIALVGGGVTACTPQQPSPVQMIERHQLLLALVLTLATDEFLSRYPTFAQPFAEVSAAAIATVSTTVLTVDALTEFLRQELRQHDLQHRLSAVLDLFLEILRTEVNALLVKHQLGAPEEIRVLSTLVLTVIHDSAVRFL
jgi:hypothetical protein